MSFNRASFGKTNLWKIKPNSGTEKHQLPLYKDKPRGKHKSRKLMAILRFFLASLLVYFFYSYSGFFKTKAPVSFQSDWKLRQQEVKDVFLESWQTYRKYGWGKDEFHPIKQYGENMGPKPLGWIIVDSLDTLMLMDAKEEIATAKEWVINELDYEFDYNVNVFETTIRMLGGLLSAFYLSNEDIYLDKATGLAQQLIGGFNSPTGLPYSSVNLLKRIGLENHLDNGASSTSEVATLQLELKYLSHLTGEKMFWENAERVMEVIDSNKARDGLVPIYINPTSGKFQGHLISLGSRGDSYYEYLLKQYLQTQKQEPIYGDMYQESVAGVKKNLLRKSSPSGLTFIGELQRGVDGPFSTKMDHLVCFYGGLLALGATEGLTYDEAKKLDSWTQEKESQFKIGEELTYTCYRMYHDTATGLAPEIAIFNENENNNYDFSIKRLDTHNLQRPETVESLFYLYRLTGDLKYREYGYEIFQNFVKHSKVISEQGDVAYTSLNDVTKVPAPKRDNMESFWFAETLKYLYLLFDDENKLPLDKTVFNTEAHPFPTFALTNNLATGWRRKIDPNKKPKMPETINGIDKNKIPEAAPADKPLEKEVLEEANKNPKIMEDTYDKEKLDRYLKDIVS